MHGAPDRCGRAADVVGRDGRLGHRAIVLNGRFRDDVAVPDEPVTRFRSGVVVTDDLERSRVTVFFRLLLAIPHLVVVALWGIAAVAVTVVLWLALLFEGRAPKSLQGFVVTYVRYSVQVSAYLHLAASPWPRFGGSDGYPVDVEIEPARRQPRGRVAARLVLALPVLMLAAVVGGSRVRRALGLGLVGRRRLDLGRCRKRRRRRGRSGRVPGVVRVARQGTDTERSPGPRSLRHRVLGPGHGLPPPRHGSLSDVGSRAGTAAGLASTSSRPARARRRPEAIAPDGLLPAPARDPAPRLALAVGRARPRRRARRLVPRPRPRTRAVGPAPLHRRLGAVCGARRRVLFLVGGPFPGFVGAAGSYPVDLAIDAPQRQHRLITLFRLWLAVPALILSTAYTFVVWVVALLGWWAALCTGRMPEGIRNLGAVGLRYSGQANAYLLLLTDRYPYSAPAIRDRPRPEQLSFDLEPPPDGVAAPRGIEAA